MSKATEPAPAQQIHALLAAPPRVELLTRDHMVEKKLGNTRRYDVFHPSAWGSCLKKVAYQWYNESEKFLNVSADDIDLRKERVFDNGHGVHHRWQKYLDKAGVLRGAWKCCNPSCGLIYGEHEVLGIFNPDRDPNWRCACGAHENEYHELLVESEPWFNFHGHCDGVIDVRGTKYETRRPTDVYVVDFKTMNDDMFSDLIHPKTEHVIQTQIYMWILNLQAAVVVYECKNNQALKELFVPRDDKLIETIKRQAVWMREVLRRRLLPNRPDGFARSDFPCRECEFQRLCWSH